MNQDTPEQGNSSEKKASPFDGLSKDELVKKCKFLLSLIQKTKQSKEELAEENKNLKEEIGNYESQKNSDKKCLKAMQEVVDSLTENKLSCTMKITELNGVIKSLEVKLKETTVNREKTLEALSIENEAFKRQINRLTDENDSLAADVTSMDVKLKEVSKIGVEQQNLLIQLRDMTSNREKDSQILEETRAQLTQITEENKKLQENLKSIEEKHQKDLEKTSSKMKLYRGKIVEMSTKLKQLKQSYKTMVDIVQDYSQSVPNWQTEMQIVAQRMHKFVEERNHEQKEHMERIKELEELIRKQNQEVDSSQNEKNQIEIEELRTKCKDLENNLSRKDEEFTLALKEKITSSTVELTMQLTQCQDKIQGQETILKEMESHYASMIDSNVSKHREEEESLRQEILKLTEHSQSLDEVLKDKNTELTSLMESVENESRNILENQKKEVEKFKDEILNLSEQTRILEEKLMEKESETSHLEESFNTETKTLSENHEMQVGILQKEIKELTEKCQMLEESKEANILPLNERIQELENKSQKLKDLLNKKEDDISQISKSKEEEFEALKQKHEEEIQDLQKNIQESRNKTQELEDQLKSKEMECLKLSETLKDDQAAQQQSLEAKVQDLEDQLDRKDTDTENLTKSFEEKLKTILENHQSDLDKLRQEVENLQAGTSTLEIQLKEKDQLIQEQVKELQKYKQELKSQSSLAEQVKSFKAEAQLQVENLNQKLQEAESRYKIENSDLLKEMKEINEVLKERGEIISRQQLDFEEVQAQNEKLRQQLQESEGRIDELQKRMLSSPDPNTSSSQIHLEEGSEGGGENFEEKYSKLRTLAQKLKKKVSEQVIQIATLEEGVRERENLQKENEKLRGTVEKLDSTESADVKSLKKEKEAFLITQRQLQKEIEDLRKNLTESKNQLKDAVQREQNIKSELEKLKTVAKKSNVLSLEIDAYEKSLNEVSQKLDAKKHQVQDLETSLESQRESIKVLNYQIRVLEENLKSEQTHSADLKKQIDSQQKKLRESDHDKTELRLKLDQATKKIENGQQDLDEMRSQLSDKGRENEKIGLNLQAERDKFVRQIFNLEEEVKSLRSEIADKSKELEESLAEFSSYKVRAQTVLMKRHETKDTSREKELEEEVCALQSTVESLNARHGALKQQHDELERMVKVFQDDKVRSQMRLKELMTQVEDSRLSNESLIEANKKHMQEHQEALKTQRLHIETLNACFKTQIDDLHEKYSKELANIRVQPEIPTVAETTNIPDVRKEERNRYPFDLATTDEQKMDLMLMEREDGEGSENTSQSSQAATRKTSRSRRDLIPLDELLNSPFEEHSQSFEGATAGSISPNAELLATKDKLQASENHIKHLTALLAEAEQDLAKLSQLNEMLKEEVRRQQRSLERETHMHNSEYLKNVVFKFLTLNSGDEKAHLVPVLNTILKLSPDETQKLQSVARGGEGLGWGSFLPIWSNHQ
ncbi:hypothetical protein DMENIID0001_033860 [Sergentomyia squamirostris]